METKTDMFDPLIERVEAYGNTTVELLKLKSVAKTAEVSSTLISRSLFLIALSFLTFMLHVSAALWLGEMVGKNYYGFLIVAAFDALVAIVIYFMHPFIKSRFNNSIIKQLLN